MSGLLPTNEAARILGVKPRTLQKMCRERRIRHYRKGRSLQFDRRDLEAYIQVVEPLRPTACWTLPNPLHDQPQAVPASSILRVVR